MIFKQSHGIVIFLLGSLGFFSSAFQTTLLPIFLSRSRRSSYALNDAANNLDDNDIIASMETQGLSKQSQETILSHLSSTSLWQEGQSSNSLTLLARDFVERPEVFASILINDFGFPPLAAHQTRAVAMAVIKHGNTKKEKEEATPPTLKVEAEPWNIIRDEERSNGSITMSQPNTNKSKTTKREKVNKIKDSPLKNSTDAHLETFADQKQKKKKSNFKRMVVNEKAKARRRAGNYEYALHEEMFPQLASDLQSFYAFMTRPSTHSQEDPIRPATADVYMRHARQFMGWYVKENECEMTLNESLSLYEIIPDKEKDSANCVIDFVLWLRSRDVSVSYEANILRGLTKLLKFRFSRESTTDPSNSGNTFDDIPLIKEIRKLHRDANKRQRLAPRSSNEQRKWLSWPEYLKVIKDIKTELLNLIEDFYSPESTCRKGKIAETYQYYLILSLFASIPDRQRTMRELAIGSTLVKNEESELWTVKHGPDDYKTGKSYGERPTIQLRDNLSRAIDDFVDNWRPALEPSTDFLFVQSKTGKPLTGDGIFHRVSRCCFKYGGKKTNPHLLRDMIVTHVRESDASEKELEALALYMGHSLNMQRTSYDRRTLTTKIAPAVELMQSINTSEK
jgi:hypothetical protein